MVCGGSRRDRGAGNAFEESCHIGRAIPRRASPQAPRGSSLSRLSRRRVTPAQSITTSSGSPHGPIGSLPSIAVCHSCVSFAGSSQGPARSMKLRPDTHRDALATVGEVRMPGSAIGRYRDPRSENRADASRHRTSTSRRVKGEPCSWLEPMSLRVNRGLHYPRASSRFAKIVIADRRAVVEGLACVLRRLDWIDTPESAAVEIDHEWLRVDLRDGRRASTVPRCPWFEWLASADDQGLLVLRNHSRTARGSAWTTIDEGLSDLGLFGLPHASTAHRSRSRTAAGAMTTRCCRARDAPT